MSIENVLEKEEIYKGLVWKKVNISYTKNGGTVRGNHIFSVLDISTDYMGKIWPVIEDILIGEGPLRHFNSVLLSGNETDEGIVGYRFDLDGYKFSDSEVKYIQKVLQKHYPNVSNKAESSNNKDQRTHKESLFERNRRVLHSKGRKPRF